MRQAVFVRLSNGKAAGAGSNQKVFYTSGLIFYTNQGIQARLCP